MNSDVVMQPTITTTPVLSVYQRAARLIPGIRHSSIKGDGAYGLKLLCPLNRCILLFETSTARRRHLDKLDRGTCCSTCQGNHHILDLVEYLK
jgi:hypothetical protein